MGCNASFSDPINDLQIFMHPDFYINYQKLFPLIGRHTNCMFFDNKSNPEDFGKPIYFAVFVLSSEINRSLFQVDSRENAANRRILAGAGG
jgi:hypothetical protein